MLPAAWKHNMSKTKATVLLSRHLDSLLTRRAKLREASPQAPLAKLDEEIDEVAEKLAVELRSAKVMI